LGIEYALKFMGSKISSYCAAKENTHL
ncbi:MAG: hypothetical protein QOF94_205, partial [Acidobacteriaceae bacterium]